MLGMAHLGKKVSLDTLGLKVVLVVLVRLGLAMLEHLDSEENLEGLVYLVYLDSQVYQGQEVSKDNVCVCVCVCANVVGD